jgi:large subunit ribosomal protein L9
MKKVVRLKEVILLQTVSGLGTIGSIAKVRSGYFRNYLFPRKYAILANSSNMKSFEKKKEELIKIEEAKEKKALELSEKFEGISISLKETVSHDGLLYGSVGNRDISEALLSQHNINVEHNKIALSKKIKELGEYEVSIQLHANVASKIKVIVLADTQDQ